MTNLPIAGVEEAFADYADFFTGVGVEEAEIYLHFALEGEHFCEGTVMDFFVGILDKGGSERDGGCEGVELVGCVHFF